MSPGKTRSAKYRQDQQLKFDNLLVEEFYASEREDNLHRPPARIITGGSRMAEYDREGVAGDLIAEAGIESDFSPIIGYTPKNDPIQESSPTHEPSTRLNRLNTPLPEPAESQRLESRRFESRRPELVEDVSDSIEDHEGLLPDTAPPASMLKFAAAIGLGLAASMLILVGIALALGI